jgi:hypothetical protein
VADELYRSPLPLVALMESDFAKLRTDDELMIKDSGQVIIHRQE